MKVQLVEQVPIGGKKLGYSIEEKLTSKEAEEYHNEQIKTISKTDAELVTAFTLSYTQEAVGIVNAFKKYNMPVVIGFTLETNGTLPSWESLKDAI